MDLTNDELNNLIDDRVKTLFKSGAFRSKKITDTPTDNLQVVNKKYVDSTVSSVVSSAIGALTQNSLQSTFTAGDQITAGQAVIMGAGSTYTRISQTQDDSVKYSINQAASNGAGQTFTTGTKIKQIYGVTFKINSTGLSAGNVNVQLRAVSGGLPTGPNLASTTVLAPGNTITTVTAVFSSPVSVSTNTQYCFTCFGASFTGDVEHTSSSVYSGGTAITTNDNGSTWTAQTTDLTFSVIEIDTVSGEISPADTTLQGDLSDNFTGFSVSSIAASGTGPVITDGVVTVLSGLTPGSTYYLSDTPGSISTSAGTVSRKIGLALSATTLLIKHDNP